ncbi:MULTISPECIES: LysE/ArgO family amino acid transporter [Streptomyces]|uniref:LysE/ArgO family amino acid transporter n=1 Tax=Streptomyces TaxID=1883 RepID=UPI001602452F|nr:LysE family transporter [Streptomyces murinus]MBA9044012.1 L-lysine exporter family protein LysE/ArgO [Streptomyces murinus]
MNHTALTAAVAGFGTGLSLIVAIGAQNAFVLRQGVRRDAVLAVVGICALSDAVLIALGVGGVGAVVVAWPGAVRAVGIGGGVFLLCYGALAARRVVRPTGTGLTVTGEAAGSRRRAVLTCLAMTWLNPHVYLDTVFLLGSLAADQGRLRWTFGLGAALASLCWFTALGFGARLLSRPLARPGAWRLLDGLVALTMLVLGVSLLLGG